MGKPSLLHLSLVKSDLQYSTLFLCTCILGYRRSVTSAAVYLSNYTNIIGGNPRKTRMRQDSYYAIREIECLADQGEEPSFVKSKIRDNKVQWRHATVPRLSQFKMITDIALEAAPSGKTP